VFCTQRIRLLEAPLPKGCAGALRACYGARTLGATSARSTSATAAGGNGADPRLCTVVAAPSASAGAPPPRAPGACAAAAAAAQHAAAACSARNSSSTSFLRRYRVGLVRGLPYPGAVRNVSLQQDLLQRMKHTRCRT